jgi:hypothetical protein
MTQLNSAVGADAPANEKWQHGTESDHAITEDSFERARRTFFGEANPKPSRSMNAPGVAESR